MTDVKTKIAEGCQFLINSRPPECLEKERKNLLRRGMMLYKSKTATEKTGELGLYPLYIVAAGLVGAVGGWLVKKDRYETKVDFFHWLVDVKKLSSDKANEIVDRLDSSWSKSSSNVFEAIKIIAAMGFGAYILGSLTKRFSK